MNVMRRNRRCQKALAPVPKQQHSKFFSNIFFAVPVIFFFSISSHAQLTYATLTIQYDSPWVCHNLQLIPIKFKDTAAGKKDLRSNEVISFEEALKEGKIVVKEMSTPGGADVGMLTLKNHSKKSILIESGEMVTGGKQDRAFAGTTLIPPDD
ncbi:MAG: DUF6569 family protein, partial [Panacibacter sp.]